MDSIELNPGKTPGAPPGVSAETASDQLRGLLGRWFRPEIAAMLAPAVREWFSAGDPNAAYFDAQARPLPQTANKDDGTIDCVWYGGATVPRLDQKTGKPYMLTLAMDGCRMERLNAGAPIFDSHFDGSGLKSILAGLVSGKTGTRAQVGVVQQAWSADGKGLAKLRFDLGSDDGAEMFRKVSTGIVQNLSFGTWIYKMEGPSDQQTETAGNDPSNEPDSLPQFTATDWEPFEISPVPVPADFSTTFLSALGAGHQPKQQPKERATSPQRTTAMEETLQPAGGGARTDQAVLDAARAEGATLERVRMGEIRALGVTHKFPELAESLIAAGTSTADARTRLTLASEVRLMGAQMKQHGLTDEFVNSLILTCASADQARAKIFEKLAATGQQTTAGAEFPIRSEVQLTRDGTLTEFAKMEAAVLLKYDPRFMMARKLDHQGNATGDFLAGNGPEAQKKLEELGQDYRSMALMEMAKASLEMRGVRVRGMGKMEIATRALLTRPGSQEIFAAGAETSSDFPGILANVANKTLRQAYESYPQTFKPFCRMGTAPDFKPINRAQLNDLYSLPMMNEKGEFHTATLTDSNINYQLAVFGGVVRITRKAIINDDLQAFTRVSMELGRAASTTQSNVVWGIITKNTQTMQDGAVLFSAGHKNYINGSGNGVFALGATAPPTGLTLARATLRQQKAPNGTPLNLISRYLCVGTNLETPAAQQVYPINIASSDYTKVVPEWVRSLTIITEPRLDPATGTNYPWLVIADPAQIDTIEYSFLEGQEGVYFETRQGFEVDGVEMKARMDFAAAAIEHRGMVYATGV